MKLIAVVALVIAPLIREVNPDPIGPGDPQTAAVQVVPQGAPAEASVPE